MHAIRTRSPTYFTGQTNEGRQVLLGWVTDFVGILVFDQIGTLLETKEYPLGLDLSKGLGPAAEAEVATMIEKLKRQIGFHNRPIRVKPFIIEKWQVGTRPLSEDLQDFLDRPDAFSTEDAGVYRADIDSWKAAGNCVLKWGNNYYLDAHGNTI